MTDVSPRVSIFMPTFRRALSGLTERALASVRAQTFTNWELFVIDDGSTDGTAQIIARHAHEDSRIRSVRHERNTGLPARLINEQMPNAAGEYFAFMFDDDMWYPDALEKLVQALDDNPGWAMAYGNVLFPQRDVAGRLREDVVLGHDPRRFQAARLKQSNYIANVAAVVRRDVLDRVGTFDPHILVRRVCDWDLWLRIARVATIGHVDELVGEVSGLLTADSLGHTAVIDFDLVREYMRTDRDALLVPSRVSTFAVDGLEAFGDDPPDDWVAPAARMFIDFYTQVGEPALVASWTARLADLEAAKEPGMADQAENTRRAASIVYVADGRSACSWYRCQTPGVALAHQGHNVLLDPAPDHARMMGADVVVFLRPNSSVHVDMIRALKTPGRLIVVDLDDDLWNLPTTNPHRDSWANPQVQSALTAAVKAADLVTVTTPELAEVVRTLNPNTRVLPNMLPDDAWPTAVARQSHGETVVIGWAGGSSHFADLKQLSGTVESVLSRYENAEFVFAGMDSIPFAEHPRIRRVAWGSLDDYPALLSSFDIALAPVVDDRFNRSKSDLKYVEYAIMGLPVVASAGCTYARSIRPGENGFLVKNPKDWMKMIGRLVEDPQLRISVGDAARSTAEQRLMSRNVHRWEKAYGLSAE